MAINSNEAGLLQQLQDELLTLKKEFPGVKLKKNQGPAGPFPISVECLVHPPESACFDVGAITVKIQMQRTILQLLASLSVEHTQPLDIQVSNDSLPRQLCSKIEKALLAAWEEAVVQSGRSMRQTQLLVPLQHLQKNFVGLISSIPDLVESYLSIDAEGRTVRRFTILSQVEDDAEAAAPNTALVPPDAVTTSALSSSPKDGTPEKQQATELWLPLPASQLLSDLQYLSRRLAGHVTLVQDSSLATQPATAHATQPSRLSATAKVFIPGTVHVAALPPSKSAHVQHPHTHQQVPPQPSDHTTAVVTPTISASFDAVVAAVRALAASVASIPAGAAHSGGSTAATLSSNQQQQQQLTIQVELLPTDPAWDRGPVSLWCQVRADVGATAAVASPQPQPEQQQPPGNNELVEVCLEVSKGCHMPAWLRQAFDTALVTELTKAHVMSQQSGAPARGAHAAGPLRNAVMLIENYAGVIAHDAEVAARAAGHRTALGQAAACSSSAPGGTHPSAVSSHDPQHGGEQGSGSDASSDADGSAAELLSGEYEDEYECEEDDSEGSSEGGGSVGAGQDEVQFTGEGQADDGVSVLSGPPAWAVVLEGLQLDELVAAEALTTNLQVSCSRCSATGVLMVASEAVSSSANASTARSATGTCPQCAASWSLVVRPKFIHEASNVLCVVKSDGCRPVDLLPSMYAAQCATCSSVMSIRNVQVGLPASRTCSSCHHQLSLLIPAVSFVPRGRPAGQEGQGSRAGRHTSTAAASARAALARGQGKGAFVIQVGTALPGRGSCKHYKHSYRWLRFPCCGQRFPCDLCHEENVPDGHEPRWASRMVCGFCSVEQPVGSECKACGKKLTASSSQPSGRFTRFWEGGEGCRDKSRMNKNDPHKYRNSKAKTKSAKHKRVGPKAWSKELKKDASDR